MLVVSFCKPVMHKLKILGEGNLNLINQWGGDHKKGGETKFWNFSGGSKRGEQDFWLKFSGGILEETPWSSGWTI